MNPDPNTELTAENWTEAVPHLGGYPVRPYMVLVEDYYAPPGFYDRGDAFLFQPGWGGQDGDDPIAFRFEEKPTLGEVRERIASLLVSSYLVQDRGDASRFFLGDEPGSIRTPWGTIPASVVFATRLDQDEDADAPWDNLNAILGHVDAARTLNGIAAEAAPVKAFVEWRLGAPVPSRTRAVFYARDNGGLQMVFYPRHPLRPAADNVSFSWGPDGEPLGGEREEYEEGAVGLYDAIPIAPTEDDLTKAILIYAWQQPTKPSRRGTSGRSDAPCRLHGVRGADAGAVLRVRAR